VLTDKTKAVWTVALKAVQKVYRRVVSMAVLLAVSWAVD
jgi:hypothetical protein